MEYFIIISIVLIAFLIIYSKRSQIEKQITKYRGGYDPYKISIKNIDKMEDGSQFEQYLYELLLAIGYSKVYKTVNSGDFGADIVFTDREGIKTVIQAKRYKISIPVSVDAVQQVYTSMRYYKAKKSIVITSSKYTKPCEALAGVNHVSLIDRNDLISIIDNFKAGKLRAAQDIIEQEPRVFYSSWSDMDKPDKDIKKDRLAEKKALARIKTAK